MACQGWPPLAPRIQDVMVRGVTLTLTHFILLKRKASSFRLARNGLNEWYLFRFWLCLKVHMFQASFLSHDDTHTQSHTHSRTYTHSHTPHTYTHSHMPEPPPCTHTYIHTNTHTPRNTLSKNMRNSIQFEPKTRQTWLRYLSKEDKFKIQIHFLSDDLFDSIASKIFNILF